MDVRLRTALFALVLLTAATLAWLGPRMPLEGRMFDTQQQLARHAWPVEASVPVVVIGIDDRALERYPEPYALWHPQLGRLLEGIASVKPRAIGLDIVLPTRSFDALMPGNDRQLMRGLLAARRNSHLVLGVTMDAGGQERPLFAPLASVAGGPSALGYALLPRDADDVVRRFDPRVGPGGEAVHTLAGRMAEAWNVQPASGWLNLRLKVVDRYLPVDWVLDRIEQGDAAALEQALGGKAVLIGSVLAYEDRMAFPVNLADWEPENHGQLPGVLVHAQALGSLLQGGGAQGGLIREAPFAARLLLFTAVACSFWLALSRRRALALLVLGLTSIYALGLALLVSGWYLPVLPLMLALALAIGGRSLFEAQLQLRERRRLRQTFAGYVSPVVMDEILAGRLSSGLGGEELHVCIMFADVRGFTTLSETTPAAEVVSVLNRYHALVAEAVHAQGGTLNCIMGDGIMAIFGAPKPFENPALPAFAAARHLLSLLPAFNADLVAQGKPPLAIGIGLNMGPAIVGHFGSQARHDYSAIGDTTNVAARIEGLSKALEHPVICSQSVAEALAGVATLTPLGAQDIKGHSATPVFGWRES